MKKLTALYILMFIGSMFIVSCKNKEESIAKIFVRNTNNQLITDAKVVLISDPNSDPATPAFIDTVQTNESGFAIFNLGTLFETYGKKDDKIGFFDIIVKFEDKQASEYIRARAHVTAVKTVTLP